MYRRQFIVLRWTIGERGRPPTGSLDNWAMTLRGARCATSCVRVWYGRGLNSSRSLVDLDSEIKKGVLYRFRPYGDRITRDVQEQLYSILEVRYWSQEWKSSMRIVYKRTIKPWDRKDKMFIFEEEFKTRQKGHDIIKSKILWWFVDFFIYILIGTKFSCTNCN